MKHAFCTALVASFVLSCGSDDEGGWGVYDLTITTIDDTCSPNRFSGGLEALVLRGPDVIAVPLYDTATSPAHQDLMGPSYEHDFIVDDPGCPGTSVRIELIGTEVEEDAFTIRYIQQWQRGGECMELGLFGEPPAAECTSERELRFVLIEECEQVICGIDGCTC